MADKRVRQVYRKSKNNVYMKSLLTGDTIDSRLNKLDVDSGVHRKLRRMSMKCNSHHSLIGY